MAEVINGNMEKEESQKVVTAKSMEAAQERTYMENPAKAATPKFAYNETDQIETKISLKIGCIGVGNAGNQAITTLYRNGITNHLFAINTSVNDLSNKVVIDSIPSFIAGKEGRGAGKNREKARELFKQNGRSLFSYKAFSTIINECDVIIVVFATGGGTGSEIGPTILNILQNMLNKTKKVVIAYAITPKKSDSPQAHFNNLESLNEIKKLNIPFICDDLSMMEEENNEVAYEAVLGNFVKYVRTISGEFNLHTGNGMMDQNDMLTTISTPGYQTHYHLEKITQEMIDKSSIQSLIIDQMKKSTCMNIQRDGKIEYIGVITSYPAAMSETSRTGNYSELYKYIGNTARDCFENYGEVNTSTASVHVIMSGMTMPYDRMLISEAVIKEHDAAKKKVTDDVNLDDILGSISDMSGGNSKIQGENEVDANAINTALDNFFN